MTKSPKNKASTKRQSPPLKALRATQEAAKAAGLDKMSMREINAIIAEVRRKNKKPITIQVPKKVLAEIDAQIPNWRYRESFIMAAVRQALMDSLKPKALPRPSIEAV